MEIERLNLALQTICQKFGGEWLLLGGSLVRIDIDPNRGTHDLDIVRVPMSENLSEQTALIREMKVIGLNPEQVNSEVGFFLKQNVGWEKHTRTLLRFGEGQILRPTLTLFAILKLSRGTPIDIEDLKKAAAKWGIAEFDAEIFKSWSDEKILLLAKGLGLL